jgi:signal transduction histidine kinase
MKEQIKRMTTLTTQLLAYARGGMYRQETILLNDFVRDAIPLIKHAIDPSIEVRMEFGLDSSCIYVDPSQMQMLLSEVFKNASEAINADGLIRIRTGHETLNDDYCKEHPGLKPGSYSCITIDDNGKGMSEKIRSRAFEPFFTTKFQGRGLGLAAAYGIVKGHDGYISIDSQEGHGTCVRIYLPSGTEGLVPRPFSISDMLGEVGETVDATDHQ